MRTRINQIRKLKNKDRGKTQKTKSTILTLSFPEGASCAIISPQGRGVGTLETGPRWRPARPLVGVREQALGGALEALDTWGTGPGKTGTGGTGPGETGTGGTGPGEAGTGGTGPGEAGSGGSC